jgi:lauroyl/myristoyl acyltransferase
VAAAVVGVWAAAARAGLPVILPYEPGARWLSRAFASAWVQRRVYAHLAARYRPHPAWTDRLSADPWDRERFLTCFLFKRWRRQALDSAPAQVVARLVCVDGLEHYEKARSEGSGVILLSAHLGLDSLLAVALTRLGIPVFCIQNLTALRPLGFRHMSAAEGRPLVSRAMIEACRELARGSAVLMRADGGAGRKSGDVQVPFAGATQRLTPGFAVLARRSGAVPVPVLALPEPGGRVRIRFYPPLPAPDPALPRDAWLTAFVARYAAWLEARWCEDPALIGPYYWHLRHYGTWRRAGR